MTRMQSMYHLARSPSGRRLDGWMPRRRRHRRGTQAATRAARGPDVRVRLSELRAAVDQAVDELIDALARMGEDRKIEPG